MDLQILGLNPFCMLTRMQKQYKIVTVKENAFFPGNDFELVRKVVPKPKEGEVLIKVEACGVCHGDAIVKEGLFPGLQYPRIPGHEVVGIIDQLGSKSSIGRWDRESEWDGSEDIVSAKVHFRAVLKMGGR